MENQNKNSILIKPMWFLYILGMVGYISTLVWSHIQSSQCSLAHTCTGWESFTIALFSIVIFAPMVLVSAISVLSSFIIRKKKHLYIGNSHRYLLYVSLISAFILVVWVFIALY